MSVGDDYKELQELYNPDNQIVMQHVEDTTPNNVDIICIGEDADTKSISYKMHDPLASTVNLKRSSNTNSEPSACVSLVNNQDNVLTNTTANEVDNSVGLLHKCSICGKIFSNQSEIQSHMVIHETPHQ